MVVVLISQLNGGSTHKSAFSDLAARTAGTKFGTPERMSGEQWINRSTHASSMSSGSSGSSNAGIGVLVLNLLLPRLNLASYSLVFVLHLIN